MTALQELKAIDCELSILNGISALLGWDKETILPPKAVTDRGEHLSYMSKTIHEKLTSPHLFKIIQSLSKQKLSAIDTAIVKKYHREITKARKIPTKHVEEFARLTAHSYDAWVRARKEKKFSVFAPYLHKVLEMRKKEATYINPKEHPYNVLLDQFEEGMTIDELDPVFIQLKDELPRLIKAIQQSPRYKTQKSTLGILSFPLEGQQKANLDVATFILGKNKRTHIGTSPHPFMTRISFDDVRLSTAVREGQPLFSFTSVAHEGGHALYELGISPKIKDTILCTGASTALHESQSRLWENQVCSSKHFWKYYYPYYQKIFPSLQEISFNEFYFQSNLVEPSLIRIESDEATYCLHIIIRYELERALLEGKIKIQDLPKIWSAKYQEYLGVTPKNDAEGVLQDVHWSDGSMGYFPTYAIGTIYSAMLYRVMLEEHNIKKDLELGNPQFIKNWLQKHIHQHGSMYLAKEIMKKTCKTEIDVSALMDYFWEKYGELYGITRKY